MLDRPEQSAEQLQEKDETGLSEEQKRQLRAVRRGYRAETAQVKDNGWRIEVTFMDGSSVSVSSKLLKLKSCELQTPEV